MSDVFFTVTRMSNITKTRGVRRKMIQLWEDAMKRSMGVTCFVLVFGLAMMMAQAGKKSARAEGKKSDIPHSIAESVSGPLQFAEGSLLGVAEEMPEDKYSFIPTAGKFDDARSFGEQIKHVACAQFAFFNEFEGKHPPADCEKGGHHPAATKAELITYLKKSFDYGNQVIARLNAQNALDRVEGRYGGPNTKMGISVIAVWHLTDHYGQLVEYLRMNGHVPPMTQKYGLKVR